MQFVLKNSRQQLHAHFSYHSLPTKLRRSHRPVFAPHLRNLVRTIFPHNRITVIQLSRNSRADSYTFPIYRFLPLELSPGHFPQFPFRPPSGRFRIALSQRNSLFLTLPPFVHHFVASVSLLPNGALPMLFISHGFPSVHLVVASVSLLPHGALPMLFPTVSLPSTFSSLPYRSFPTELAPCYLFPTVSLPSILSSLPYHFFLTELSPIYINIYLSNLFYLL